MTGNLNKISPNRQNENRNMPRVVIAMSGGVDSSIAAALLVKQGYEVIGMMLRLWSEPGTEKTNRCCTPDAMAQARRVAAQLGIPFYAVDAQQAFRNRVVDYFIEGYTQGITPNPCLNCNRHIRWGFLLDRARTLGAQYMATGHYARLQKDPLGGIQLLRAQDKDKDQSYVLHVLTQEQLTHTLLPLGDYTKSQVRQLACELGLPVAERADSQDLCFLGDGDYRTFLARSVPQVISPGPILDQDGRMLGKHQGLAFFTIGQRKGLGIAAPRPLYVLNKDFQQNALIVGEKQHLGKSELNVAEVNWIAGAPPIMPLRAQVKIRYRAAPVWATIPLLEKQGAHVILDQPLPNITPGQAAVFYDGEICLGGGVIQI
jgi:tRNA-specific 2-thiouridylase